ncbi:uncharacterized protein LOC122074391 [Macadamia integrifolia]|uniref:uncharacterized protein LOC122074391 n=1 Tax=Macadamia integrifolia TaxID=60698 RepID=UPI001C4EBF33|nr:uncharacterized protein LOC122074391 [Macadamia integrifolia]
MNARRHEGDSKSMECCFSMIRSEIGCQTLVHTGLFISLSDLMSARRLDFSRIQGRQRVLFEIFRCRPLRGWWKLNTNGCSLGNLGISRVSGVFQNEKMEVMANYRDHTNFEAEFLAVISGIEHSENLGVQRLWIECDSAAVVTLFQNNKVPWIVRQRWLACMRFLDRVE